MSIPAAKRRELTKKDLSLHQLVSRIESVYVRVGFLDGSAIFGGSWKIKCVIYTLLGWALSSLFTMLPLDWQTCVGMPWYVSWVPISVLAHVVMEMIFFIPSMLPLDIQCLGVHMDVVVETASLDLYDLSRAFDSGVTLTRHQEEPTLTAMLEFVVPEGHDICLSDLFKLVEREKERWYWLQGNNCHHMAFKVCEILGAPDTQSFDVFLLKNRKYYAWKKTNPM